MSANEPHLICAGPFPYSERAAELLREEGIDARAVETELAPPLLPIRIAAGVISPSIAAIESAWILYVRAGEMLPRPLAKDISRAVAADPRAFAYRIRRSLFDRTVPLMLDDPLDPDGEIRLMHRRRARFQRDGRLTLQGTVVRLGHELHVEVRESGLMDVASDGSGKAWSILLRRPWLIIHPPTVSFLVQNRRAVSGWFDRAGRETESH